jgi:excisionase family DNA binding protein
MAAMTPALLTLDDVRERLNTSPAQVYSLVRKGHLPAMKMGGRGQWRVKPECLEEYIERAHAETAAWIRLHPYQDADPDSPPGPDGA